MKEIIEATAKEFNLNEKSNQQIKNTFRSVGQDIWEDWDVLEPLFEAHLDALAKLPLYATTIDNQTSSDLQTDIDDEQS